MLGPPCRTCLARPGLQQRRQCQPPSCLLQLPAWRKIPIQPAKLALPPPLLQALNRSFNPESTMTLQQFIILFGCIQLLLCQVGSSGGCGWHNSRPSGNDRGPRWSAVWAPTGAWQRRWRAGARNGCALHVSLSAATHTDLACSNRLSRIASLRKVPLPHH